MNAGKEIAGGPQMHLLHGNEASANPDAGANGNLDPRVDRSGNFPDDDEEEGVHPFDALEFVGGNPDQPAMDDIVSRP